MKALAIGLLLAVLAGCAIVPIDHGPRYSHRPYYDHPHYYAPPPGHYPGYRH